MTDYRTFLRARGIHPMTVERTAKAEGDLVLERTDRPATVWHKGETK